MVAQSDIFTGLQPEFVTDADGRRTRVLLDIQTWEQLLEYLEDQADLRALEEARADPDSHESLPFDQAMKEIDEGRV